MDFRCEICKVDCHWVEEERNLNSPMLADKYWRYVCRYYRVPKSSIICEGCMTKVLGEIEPYMLKDCSVSKDWLEQKFEYTK